jgi:mitochondrial intermembrane space import and assembly protein 40
MFRCKSRIAGGLGIINVGTFASSCDQTNKSSPPKINIYLKPESKQLLQKHLQKRNLGDVIVPNYICVNSKAFSDSMYVFGPIFGERAAFRLKGILTLDDGRIVGVGRVSNMIGELKDQDIEASLPISRSELSAQQLLELEDLPTRLAKHPEITNKSFWKGRIPADQIQHQIYPAIRGQFVHIPLKDQIIIDGFLCTEKDYHSSANNYCNFDREAFLTSLTSTSSQENQLATPTTSTEEESSELGVAAECPVCKYMKGGPCKEAFIQWDTCIQSLADSQELRLCYEQTKNMMRCMQQYEYYDIMVAGTDFSRFDEAESLKAQLDNNNNSNNSNDNTTSVNHEETRNTTEDSDKKIHS